MATKFRLSALIPAGLIVERSDESDGVITVSARAATDQRSCPLCNRISDRIHSRYVRIIADLPCAGTKVQLRLSARRFVCEVAFCRRRIFVERFGELVVPERSRRTGRLDTVVHHLGLALGGRPAAAFAKRLMIPVSNDTLTCGNFDAPSGGRNKNCSKSYGSHERMKNLYLRKNPVLGFHLPILLDPFSWSLKA
jgi:hypothetical protein